MVYLSIKFQPDLVHKVQEDLIWTVFEFIQDFIHVHLKQ